MIPACFGFMMKATRFTIMVSAVTMAGVKGSGKEMYADTASSATQTALPVMNRICSRLPGTATDGCKFSLVSLIDFFLPAVNHFSPVDRGFEQHMDGFRFSQPDKQALPQEQSLDHRAAVQMDGVGISGAPGKSPHFFRSESPPGPVPFRRSGLPVQ